MDLSSRSELTIFLRTSSNEARRLQDLIYLLVHYQLAGSEDHGAVRVSEVGSPSAAACPL
jgi:hypothetical protein